MKKISFGNYRWKKDPESIIGEQVWKLTFYYSHTPITPPAPPPLNTPLFDIHERKSIILNAYTSKELHS